MTYQVLGKRDERKSLRHGTEGIISSKVQSKKTRLQNRGRIFIDYQMRHMGVQEN